MSPDLGSHQPYLDLLVGLCERAGQAIVEHYDSATSADHERKADASPLTAADLASHDIIVDGLAATGLPILSEESPAGEVESRRSWQRYWLVDPLDGTKEFLERTGEFTINIALVDVGAVALGLVAVPLERRVYCGAAGQGAWRLGDGGWEAIRCRTPGDTVVVQSSRRHRGDTLEACLQRLRDAGRTVERHYAGSALKFCRVAEGLADFYPRFSPCCEWDTAAGQGVLEGAGGALLDLAGKPLRYNQGEDLFSPHFHAIGDPDDPLWAHIRGH